MCVSLRLRPFADRWNSDLADYSAFTIVIDLASVLVIRTGVDVDNNWDQMSFDIFLVVLNLADCGVVCYSVCVGGNRRVWSWISAVP